MSSRRGIFHAVCLAAFLALGIQVACAVVIMWCASVASQLSPSRRPYEYLYFLPDGTPVIVTHSPTNYQSRTGRTLDGKPVSQEDLERLASGESLAGPGRPRSVRRGWSARIESYNDGGEPAIYWYFVHTERKDGHGYFVGYDSKLKRRIGYLGVSGARPDEPPPEDCFRVDGRKMGGGHTACGNYRYYLSAREPAYSYRSSPWEPIRNWMVYMVSGDRILEVDLKKRSVRTVTEAEGIVSIGLTSRLFASLADKQEMIRARRSRYLAVRMGDRVVVLDPYGDERRSYMLSEEVGAKSLEFLELAEGTAIVKTVRHPGQSGSPIDLYWIGESGGAVRSETVRLEARSPQVGLSRTETVYLAAPSGVEDPRLATAFLGLVSPVPAVWAAATTVVVPMRRLQSGESKTYAEALARAFSEAWPGVVISVLLSAGAVWVCVRRQRRYARSWTRTWAVFVFVTGVPGLLGYLFHRRWAVREECPACHAAVPRDRESCFACGNDFPEPAAKGIEVFG